MDNTGAGRLCKHTLFQKSKACRIFSCGKPFWILLCKKWNQTNGKRAINRGHFPQKRTLIMKNKRNKNLQALTESALLISLAVILSFLKLIAMPYGGAVTLASRSPSFLTVTERNTAFLRQRFTVSFNKFWTSPRSPSLPHGKAWLPLSFWIICWHFLWWVLRESSAVRSKIRPSR